MVSAERLARDVRGEAAPPISHGGQAAALHRRCCHRRSGARCRAARQPITQAHVAAARLQRSIRTHVLHDPGKHAVRLLILGSDAAAGAAADHRRCARFKERKPGRIRERSRAVTSAPGRARRAPGASAPHRAGVRPPAPGAASPRRASRPPPPAPRWHPARPGDRTPAPQVQARPPRGQRLDARHARAQCRGARLVQARKRGEDQHLATAGEQARALGACAGACRAPRAAAGAPRHRRVRERTLRRGSSASTVPTPVSIAELRARQACTSARAASPVIHWLVPSASAVRPSRLMASFTRTHGSPVRMRLKNPAFSSCASASSRPDCTAMPAAVERSGALAVDLRIRVADRVHHACHARRRSGAACTGAVRPW